MDVVRFLLAFIAQPTKPQQGHNTEAAKENVTSLMCLECSLIYGFVSKEEAKRMLISRDCGTFLLRFSEADIEQSQKSEICGCLTLAFVEIDPNTGGVFF